MFTIIAFILTILGSINWLMIGLLQYDFVAGIFGYQGSVFSRIVYIIVGSACVYLVYKTIKGKGTLAVFSKRNKKDLQKKVVKMQKQQVSNVEAGEEDIPQMPNEHYERSEKGLFDEHFRED